MNLTGFAFNVIVALVLSLIGVSLSMGLSVMLVMACLAGCYLLWLFFSHRSRRGLALVFILWVCVTAVLLTAGIGILSALLVYSGLVWITRACLRYQAPLKAMLDGAISVMAIGLSIWVAQQTHSLWLTLWAYFFAQSLVFLIPGTMPSKPAMPVAKGRFSQACRNAELALDRLQSNH